jgi:hypothetical protein
MWCIRSEVMAAELHPSLIGPIADLVALMQPVERAKDLAVCTGLRLSCGHCR